MQIKKSISENTALFDGLLRTGKSFDLIRRTITVGGRGAVMYMIDGFVKDEVMEKIMEFMMSADEQDMRGYSTAQEFAERYVSYVETSFERDAQKVVTFVLSGSIALIIDGFDEAVMIDARTYPVRSVGEPEDDRVLRGAHDGFVEALVFNTALVRRRIRDPQLTIELHTVGRQSRTDVALCWLDGRADQEHVDKLRKTIKHLRVNSLSMAQESLAEAIVKHGWYNPFPKVRYTERPDSAAAAVLEGRILVIVDASPTVMVLPASIFDFLQDSNDYYFPPLAGSYLRLIRLFVSLLTVFLTPVWLLLTLNPDAVPPWLEFIKITEPYSVPLIAQLLLFEVVIDALKLASLNTPSALSNSFSVVGALILGEFAISSGWLVPQAILYMSIVAIGNFTQPSFELGYAFKFTRVLLLILSALFGLWGFIGGTVVFILLIATNRTILKTSYLYPLIPFNGKAFSRLIIRRRMNNDNS